MLYKFFNFILYYMGYIPLYREKRLIQEIILLEQEVSKLEKEIYELKDENASLWSMLDETHKSDISKNKNAIKLLMEEIQETLTEGMMDDMMKDFKPIGEA
jgi:predicted RNase H-like nuclease (RuvC/YqgF family)